MLIKVKFSEKQVMCFIMSYYLKAILHSSHQKGEGGMEVDEIETGIIE